MQGKKEMLAKVCAAGGATRLLEALPTRPSLLILNYHRVGDAAQTPYDSGTFSCTAAELDWQVGWIAARFPLVTLREAEAVVHGETRPQRTAVLLTFDDGYRDNFDVAFPVLQRHGVSATFFLPTAFAGTNQLPWWDVIAAVVKRTRQPRIDLRYPEPTSFDLSGEAQEPAGPKRLAAIRDILKLYKTPATTDTDRFLREVQAACETAPPDAESERCFLTWEEARTMQAAGMCFGSHTHTHPILSKLPAAEQRREVETSRTILERELQQPVTALAYPVGRRDSFSAETVHALQAAGYKTAFSFYSGVNEPGAVMPFDVRRMAVDPDSRAVFRLRIGTAARTGRSLV